MTAPNDTVIFNSTGDSTTAVDASDAYANKHQLYLSVFHLPSQIEVNLKAFVTTYTETFSSDWAQEPVFGRNDPIATFKHTSRRIAVSVDIPAFSMKEAKDNLSKCNRLAQFTYPAYLHGNRANTLAKPPLLRVTFANLIRNAAVPHSPHAKESGLLGFITSLSIVPSFGETNFFQSDVAVIYPQLLTVNFDYIVLHEHDMGWGNELGFAKNEQLANFPFGDTGLVQTDIPADSVTRVSQPSSPDTRVSAGATPPVVTAAEDDENADMNADADSDPQYAYDEHGVAYTSHERLRAYAHREGLDSPQTLGFANLTDEQADQTLDSLLTRGVDL